MMGTMLMVVLGAAAGAGLGHWGKCSSGTCPLMATWWRGALYGGLLGYLFAVTLGNPSSRTLDQSTTNVVKIEQKDFEKTVLASPGPVLVDFYAPWCGPCHAMAPVVERLAGEYKGKVNFAKVNIDEAPALAQRYQIEGIPFLVVFSNGKIVDRFVGVTSAEELKRRLQAVVSAGG